MAAFLMLLRWLHFLLGITWIGLLYYLNFVQTPFFAETEAAVRSGAQQKLLPRVLWWFRWGAMGTVIFGAIYLIIWWSREGYGLNTWAIAILTGGTLGIIMWANVWLVIWPKQKVVIANAIATAGGAPSNPAAASAGRRAALASRTNVLFSIPMLFFMGAASHYALFTQSNPHLRRVAAWLVICGAIVALIEINALVGTQGVPKKPLDTIPGLIWSDFVLWVILTGIIVLVFRS